MTIRAYGVANSELVTRTFLVLWIAGCLSVLVDLDHLWNYSGMEEPINLTGWVGRPLHHPMVFVLYASICGLLTVAFMARLYVGVDRMHEVPATCKGYCLIVTKTCAICGKNLQVAINQDGTYSGGHYFGRIPANSIEAEYWECDACFNQEDEQ